MYGENLGRIWNGGAEQRSEGSHEGLPSVLSQKPAGVSSVPRVPVSLTEAWQLLWVTERSPGLSSLAFVSKAPPPLGRGPLSPIYHVTLEKLLKFFPICRMVPV